MDLTYWDGIAFVLFLFTVIGISIYASRKEDNSEDYFLAGRSLPWWLIGFSLIASNISSEHFVGMAGQGFGANGLAVASYEWVAAIALVVVGLYLLPKFLKLGIYTIPEYLEHRYGGPARTFMATYMMIAYVGVAIASVLYAGSLGLNAIFDLNMYTGIWLIGIIGGIYTIYGGLKAVVWSDLLQGGALLIGGSIVAIIGFSKVGGFSEFMTQNADKMHVGLPADHPTYPWTALVLAIWIPNFFYWGFNQFITQRTLGAKSLSQGQLGIVFAAAIKLLIPFIIVFPGIMAFQLYGSEITNPDQAYPILINKLLPVGLRGVLFAALFGAVMSSLDSMLNSASTIFTIDIYKRHFKPEAEPKRIVKVGRIATGIFCIAGCLLAPVPGNFEGIFDFIQKFWGFLSPAIVAVFFFGMFFKRAPLQACIAAFIIGPVCYGILLFTYPNVAFLNHMATSFILVCIVMAIITILKPLKEPVVFDKKPQDVDIDLSSNPIAKKVGYAVIVATLMLYVIFW